MDNIRELICAVCKKPFSFSEEEKALYAQLGFAKSPRRCAACRMSKKAIGEAVKPKRIMYDALCDKCGCQTQLPFKPTGEKPVYCKACFEQQKA